MTFKRDDVIWHLAFIALLCKMGDERGNGDSKWWCGEHSDCAEKYCFLSGKSIINEAPHNNKQIEGGGGL